MKTSFILYILCFSLIACWTSCEKAIDTNISHKSSSQSQLLPRDGGECDNCPIDDCCCAVWLQPSEQEARIRLCGSSDGLLSCSGNATGNCSAFSGGGHSWILQDGGFEKAIFCMDQGDPFYVSNFASSDPANIIVSCQNGATNPDTMWIQLGAGTSRYIQTNGSCEILPCQ